MSSGRTPGWPAASVRRCARCRSPLDALERQQKIFGADPWPYGLMANRAVLAVFADHLVGQGLTANRIE